MRGAVKIVILAVATLALLLLTLLLVRIEPLMAMALPGVFQLVAAIVRAMWRTRTDHGDGLSIEVALPDTDL